jgi:hypothetical protein
LFITKLKIGKSLFSIFFQEIISVLTNLLGYLFKPLIKQDIIS